MATFTISITNSDFRADDEYEVADIESAKKEAVSGALQIGIEEIKRGEKFFAAEVSVGQGEDVLARYLVSLGAAPLQ